MDQPDLDIITKAISETLRGNPDAYTVIVTSYMQKLYATARSVCGNDAAAEDLVQETLIDGYLHLSSLREVEKIECWLMRILKNKAFNYFTRSRRTESEEILQTLADRHTPESLYVAGETLREWKRRLNVLSPALRETAILYFWDNLSMETIAQRTKTPLGTVKRRIHDAREKLKKENNMTNEKHTLPDAFAEALAEKIRELENYTKTYSSSKGFDTAYTNVKKLIANLSDKEDVKEYSVKSACIAANTDMDKYAEEALAVYRKFGEVEKAQHLLLDICWKKKDDYTSKLNYTLETVLPELEGYPDSEDRSAALGYHLFWAAHYVDKATPEGIAQARGYLDRAMAEYDKTEKVDASYANTVSAFKALEVLEDEHARRDVLVTGETWRIEEGNLYFYNQPGCDYAYDGNLNRFHNYIFINAGWAGDRYFFPRTVPIEAGREELMTDEDGNDVGIRRVISVNDTVETPAGVFTDCILLEKVDKENDVIRVWYKDGVGIVKVCCSDNPLGDKVLASYEIHGGEGYLPLAVGNKWCYESPDKPDFMFERHEYVIERKGKHTHAGESVCVSALNYAAFKKDRENRIDDPTLLLFTVGDLCEKKMYPEAAEKLRKIVMFNRDRKSVDIALSVLEYLGEKLPYDEKNWRFCPSSANISTVTLREGMISYGEGREVCFEMGPWGTRHQENRIFGVKPFRYLQELCYTLWDERWVPGYTSEHKHGWKDTTVKLAVDEGGTVETPAGIFTDTVHLTVSCSVPGCNPDDFFYDNVDCGVKEYWFAKGVGVVRFKCTWGEDILDSDCLLTEYHTVASPDEMMPIHIGNRWRYEEKYLTEENYIARRDYKILSGQNDRYLMADHQMFTWRGSVDEYEEWKKTL